MFPLCSNLLARPLKDSMEETACFISSFKAFATVSAKLAFSVRKPPMIERLPIL
ncbi:MAG: hypothetical protein ACD_32C00043G0001 [uncultured bacterium]|nr:MAG: hypothetical protein ACD_32C00043G0001 [uncultured bacterium]